MKLSPRETDLIKSMMYALTMFASVIAISCLVAGIMSYSHDKEKKYTIEAGSAVYHTDSFRMYGKGVVFSTDDQEVILMGDFQILKQKQP